MEAQWLADRTTLRTLLRTQPHWRLDDYMEATGRSRGWVKKWIARFRTNPGHSDAVLFGRSRARHHPPEPLSPQVIDRILAIRDQPPQNLRRIPGPKAILYYLQQDPTLQQQAVRLPRSTRTIWRILTDHGRIRADVAHPHHPLPRPDPMTVWQLDFKDASTVPPDPDGKQQHLVEVLNIVDAGTSVLVDAHVRDDFTAETALLAVAQTLLSWLLRSSAPNIRRMRQVATTARKHLAAAPRRAEHGAGGMKERPRSSTIQLGGAV